MDAVVAMRVRITEQKGERLEFSVETAESATRLSFEGPGIFASGEAVLAATLLPAMRCADRLELPLPVSARLLHQAQMLQEIWHCWWPQFRIVKIDAPVAEDPCRGGTRVGMFFTGGSDSCCTLIRRQTEVDTLIYVTGLEPGIADPAVHREVVGRLRNSAERLGKRFVEIRSDIRRFSDPYCYWGTHYHGSALAAVAHLLPDLGRVYIASSNSYRELFPLGSHALTDPLWSTPTREIVHEGADISRLDRFRAISESELARSVLRVCPDNEGGAYNCGKCSKCLRTIATLACLGTLDRFPTLPQHLDLQAVSRMSITFGARYMVRDAIAEARTHGRAPQVVRALEDALDERYTRPLHCLAERTGRRALGVYRGVKRLVKRGGPTSSRQS